MSPLFVLAVTAVTSTVTPLAAVADRLLVNYTTAWNRSDAVALTKLFTVDGELVTPVGSAAGRADIARLYDGAFTSGLPATILTADVDRVAAVAPGVAFGRGAWRLTPRGDATGAAYCGRFFTVMRRDGATWRIAAFDEVELACAPASK